MLSEKTKRFFTYLESITGWQETVTFIANQAATRGGAYVAVGNTHQCILACESKDFADTIQTASALTTDSQVLAFASRILLGKSVEILRGWELVLEICRVCEKQGLPVALFGGTPRAANRMTSIINEQFPSIKLVATISPPFRPLTSEENQAYTRQLNQSGAAVVFVGLGCPKQEEWMQKSAHYVNGVSIGVGAAFDFLSGTTRRSPDWVHRFGLEWLWRFCQEPKRLGRRYLEYNSKFIYMMINAAFSKGRHLPPQV